MAKHRHRSRSLCALRVMSIRSAALVVVLLSLGCRETPVTPNTPAVAKIPITIGTVLPRSGPAGAYGKSCLTGADLAASEINAAGGIKGRPLSLIHEDSESRDEQALSALNKLLDVNRPVAVVGEMFSTATKVMAPVAQERGVVLLSPTTSSLAVPAIGDYIFTIYPSDAYDGQYLSRSLVRLWPSTRRVALVFEQTEAMIGVKDAFKAGLPANTSVVAEEAILPSTRDFRSILNKFRRKKADIVFVAAGVTQSANLVRQASPRILDAHFLGISTCYDPKFVELAGEGASRMIFTAPVFDSGASAPAVAKFVSGYRAKYGSAPDVWAAYGYDAVMILTDALRKSDGTSASLRNAVASTRDFKGATGVTSIRPDRGADKELRLLKVDARTNAFVSAE